MKLLSAGLIFGAGYVLGHPKGRAKLAELVQGPEVAQLRQQALSAAYNAAKTSQQQLTKTARKVKDSRTEKRAGQVPNGSDAGAHRGGSRRGLRLPPFPRWGGRPDASADPAVEPVQSATGTASDDTSESKAVNAAN